jgi:hypothetical protein
MLRVAARRRRKLSSETSGGAVIAAVDGWAATAEVGICQRVQSGLKSAVADARSVESEGRGIGARSSRLCPALACQCMGSGHV